jgi:hypothetical protein
MCVLLYLMVQISFSSSGFGSFKLLHTLSSRSSFIQNTRSLDACLPLDLMASICFSSLGFGSFNSCALIPPGVLSPEVSNLLPPAPLGNGQSMSASKLWYFSKSSLLCTQRIKAHALYLDQMTVDPLHSDPMVGIYFFLWNSSFIMDPDLTVQVPSYGRSDSFCRSSS